LSACNKRRFRFVWLAGFKINLERQTDEHHQRGDWTCAPRRSVVHENMTMYPCTRCRMMEAWIRITSSWTKRWPRAAAHVAEISEAGSVPELKFVNESDRAVLLVDGEELRTDCRPRSLRFRRHLEQAHAQTPPQLCARCSRSKQRIEVRAAREGVPGRFSRCDRVSETGTIR